MVNASNDDHLSGRIGDDPIAQSLPKRATFIPLRHADLQQAIGDEFSLSSTEFEAFEDLCQQFQQLFHVEHQAALQQLETLYERLDPDSQLVELQAITDVDLATTGDQLIELVSELLLSAHYKRLSIGELKRAIEIGWQWGVKLDVDLDLFDRLEIFARGYQSVLVTRRRWQRLFRLETIELPEFTRLIIAFRVNRKRAANLQSRNSRQLFDSRFVYLKTFKNIPETDLEILLPGSRVRLTKFDRAKILFPTISGLAITGFKIARGALLLTLAFNWNMIFGWTVLIGATVGYIVKSVLSYFRTKTNYQFGLTQSLYLKNLDNNLGVLYRILNEAEEQEVSEVILAYAFLWKSTENGGDGFSAKGLDLAVEAFLAQTTQLDVDFEVHDGLQKLQRLGLATVDSDGHWTAVTMDQARPLLGQTWQQLFRKITR